MTTQIDKKELVTIWYDGEIKAQIKSTGKVVTKGIDKLLNSLTDKKEVRHHVGIKELVVEFDNVVIRIDGYKKFIKNDTFLRFYKGRIINLDSLIKNNVQPVEIKRTKSLIKQQETKKQNLLSDDYLSPISAALEKRRREVLEAYSKQLSDKENVHANPTLKVNRNKKRSSAIRVTAFVTAALAVGGFVVSGKKELEEIDPITRKEFVVSDINEDSKEYQIFKPEIDIATVFPEVIAENTELSYEDNSNCDKVLKTKNNYYDIIQKYSRKCGLDPKLVLGIATHESGNHEYGLAHGNNGGLMQIEIDFWDGKEIEYYDFDEHENYIIKIDREVIKDLNNNILIGCALLQNELRMFNDNILLATLSYNQGYNNTNKILNKTSLETGIPKMDIVNNPACLSWLDYVKESNVGDPNYVPNVLQYTGFGYDTFEFMCKKENGDIVIATTGPIISENLKTI